VNRFHYFVLHKQISFIPKVTSFLLNHFSEPIRSLKVWLGYEDFCFPGTSKPQSFLVKEPTLVHAHNLFPVFFDFRSLEAISNKYPTLLTAHDCWMMTGHCAHFFDCEKYKSGCGNCPDLSIAPSINKDRTKCNLKNKKNILSRSNIYLATPCKWLKTKFQESNIGATFSEIRVIPNGVNTDEFYPKANKKSLREKYNLEQNSLIFSFVGNQTKDNPWKNFSLMYDTLKELGNRLKRKVIFLCIGEKADPIIASPYFSCNFVGHIRETAKLNDLYNSSDFYLHLAKADTFPNTILEAQSCGIPVFANPVCGIPEQINEGQTGWLLRDILPERLAESIKPIITCIDYSVVSKNCRNHILENFSEESMVSNYRQYYKEILSKILNK
jgi:glycosyltransferase involved in cell wall biosynthesis